MNGQQRRMNERDGAGDGGENQMDRTKLIINYIPQFTSEEELANIFSQVGQIESIRIMRDFRNGYSYGFGLVKYTKSEFATKAIEIFNGMKFRNKRLKVSYSRPAGQDMKDSNLYITNLPKNFTEEDIAKTFGEYGEIIQKTILRDKITGLPRGVAFVRYVKAEEAQAAIAALDGKQLENAMLPLSIRLAEDHGRQKTFYFDCTNHEYLYNTMFNKVPQIQETVISASIVDNRSPKITCTMEAIINDIKSKPLEDSVKAKDMEETIDPLDEVIRRPFNYIISIPGKQIRLTLIEMLNYWLEIPQDKMKIISDIVFNIHNGSILIDDIQDRSILRRGVPAAHTIFGIGNTINSATFIGWKNIDLAIALNHPEAVRVSQDSMRTLLAGQGMEIYWRDKFICPTEEEYLQMIARKSTGLFHYSNNLMQLFTTKKKNPGKLLTCLGMYFQINDDYQNLNSEFFFQSKGFCEDLTEGKFGFPLVHAINSCPKEGKLIMEIIRQRTTDIALKKKCISHIEACGSFEYTKNKMAELRRIIFEEIERLGTNPFIDTFFEKLAIASV